MIPIVPISERAVRIEISKQSLELSDRKLIVFDMVTDVKVDEDLPWVEVVSPGFIAVINAMTKINMGRKRSISPYSL